MSNIRILSKPASATRSEIVPPRLIGFGATVTLDVDPRFTRSKPSSNLPAEAPDGAPGPQFRLLLQPSVVDRLEGVLCRSGPQVNLR